MTSTNTQRIVLVTGAAGRIGSYFAKNVNKQKYKLRLMVHPSNSREDVESLKAHGEVIEAELENIQSLIEVCQGVDIVFHLAAQPNASTRWNILLRDNIEGTYNIFFAAKQTGVKRMVYASSIHAVSGYPVEKQIRTTDPVNPGDLYGVSKCFGEALGRYMGEQEGLSTIAIRIGAYQPYSFLNDEAKSIALMDCWLSQPDSLQLFEKCIDAPLDIKFAIVHGLSRNTFNRLDLSTTCELLDYHPKDNFLEAQKSLQTFDISNRLRSHNLHDPAQKSGLRDKSPEQKKDN